MEYLGMSVQEFQSFNKFIVWTISVAEYWCGCMQINWTIIWIEICNVSNSRVTQVSTDRFGFEMFANVWWSMGDPWLMSINFPGLQHVINTSMNEKF